LKTRHKGQLSAERSTFPALIFLAQAEALPLVGTLPQVSFVDPDFGLEGTELEDDEHPPTDIQSGQAHVSNIVTVRNGSTEHEPRVD
jgi:hypothetical protein